MPTIANLRTSLTGAAAVLALVFAAAPAVAEELDATARLGACLVSGSVGAPRDNLLAAVIAVRSLCHTQIGRVREERLAAVDARFGLPEAKLSPSEQNELEGARSAETRRLNDEIARVIAAQTGLTD